MEDDIQLQAFMRLEIYRPYTSNLGTREFQFTIRDWNLYGKSSDAQSVVLQRSARLPGENRHARTRLITSRPSSRSTSTIIIMSASTPNSGLRRHTIFASEKLIEFRESHKPRPAHLDTLSASAAGEDWLYSQPNNKVYWELLPGAAVTKKPPPRQPPAGEGPQPGGGLPLASSSTRNRRFAPRSRAGRVRCSRTRADLANYLLAAAVIEPGKAGSRALHLDLGEKPVSRAIVVIASRSTAIP